MISINTIFRWTHIISGAAWLGEVLVIAFVMVPAIADMDSNSRGIYVSKVFPRLFRMASFFVVLALVSGLTLNYYLTGWQNLGGYIRSFQGSMITIGGIFGLLLGTFHFVVESRLEGRVVKLAEKMEKGEMEKLLRYLKIIPRVGMIVLLGVFLSMMIGTRGL